MSAWRSSHIVRRASGNPAYISPASVWADEQRRLGSYMDKVAGRDNVIVSGDFNASYSNKQFRNLLTNGYTSAADQLGSGLIPTYPTDKRYPAVVGIDHIITKGAVATSFGTDRDRGIRSPRPDCRHHVVLSKYWIEQAPGHGCAPVLTSSVVAIHAAVGGLFPPMGRWNGSIDIGG